MSSTNKTANYNLSQWLPGDALSHEDVNADNAKIDAAIKSAADATAALSSAVAATPYCKIQAGTYTGTGTFNTSKNTLTFAFTPKVVIVHEASRGIFEFGYNFSARWGMTTEARTYTFQQFVFDAVHNVCRKHHDLVRSGRPRLPIKYKW
jgi:hypothetical protein